MQENNKNSFPFIHERIKQKPVNKKKLLFQGCMITGSAILFGLVASIVFTYFQPKFEKMLYPTEDPVITIPIDSAEETEKTEETERQEAKPQESQPIVSKPQEMELTDYQRLQDKLYDVGREANRFIVTVTGIKSDTDWFDNAYERKGQASGIIIADNGRELLILTERKVIAGAQELFVTFVDGTSVEASIRKHDGNTGITVLSISLEAIDEDTMSRIAVATLGNSLVTRQGMIAIAVGSPLGTNYSILTGNITATTNSISTIDHNYTVFTTDIVGSSNGSGALVNIKGEIIGLVMQDYSSVNDRNTLTAISISELKAVIEKLSNNQDIPYIGLGLTTVTNEIAKEYELPKGAYIKSVKLDSPALAAGLQVGDVITEMGGEPIFTVDAFEKKLLTLSPGESVELVIARQGANEYIERTVNVKISVLQ
ncbi:MAG: S1C family serine protease [Clostridiales bacterium]|nr:S1C family serine protease [Clostridiales bacterium]